MASYIFAIISGSNQRDSYPDNINVENKLLINGLSLNIVFEYSKSCPIKRIASLSGNLQHE